MSAHRVQVGPLPAWMDRRRLLGDGPWTHDGPTSIAELPAATAADVAARLRGLGFDGSPVEVQVQPPLSRTLVRDARTEDARRRRDTTPGFERQGVRLDDEGRWSLTPERLAVLIARRVVARGAVRVLDAGCGCGGDAIALARQGAQVTAVERDRARVELARHNARIYGVVDRIRFVHGDAAPLLSQPWDAVWVDPPWGTDYNRHAVRLEDLPWLRAVWEGAAGAVWAKVPASFVTADLPGAAVTPWFGLAGGDRQRVKFLVLTRPGA